MENEIMDVASLANDITLLIMPFVSVLIMVVITLWFKDTKAGIWCYKKYEAIANWATDRYGIDILNKEDIAWRTKYPNVAKRTDELEERINYLELEIRRLQKGKGNGK